MARANGEDGPDEHLLPPIMGQPDKRASGLPQACLKPASSLLQARSSRPRRP